MQALASRTMSSETLVRGAELLENQAMLLEGDEEYQKLAQEREKLLAPWL